ncbi:hypothetical protein [Rhodanobacter sp. MP7CTX1]|uniref:hypothetical protein n=1 Tax=Rhodanobacter sp. MP7CTX1 TaxID=2723084 RepID=UPI001619B43F|nr:hypothetical protein [Rhodanobacter sp. MP7CTX1]MBB6189553.1 hypothetical protein [Rhodanobacter sp. MP7CTX1]
MVVENPGISSVVRSVWRVEGAQTVKQTSYFIGLNTKHQALSCVCAGQCASLCGGTGPKSHSWLFWPVVSAVQSARNITLNPFSLSVF